MSCIPSLGCEVRTRSADRRIPQLSHISILSDSGRRSRHEYIRPSRLSDRSTGSFLSRTLNANFTQPSSCRSGSLQTCNQLTPPGPATEANSVEVKQTTTLTCISQRKGMQLQHAPLRLCAALSCNETFCVANRIVSHTSIQSQSLLSSTKTPLDFSIHHR